MTILNQQTMTQLDAGVSLPRYDRRQVTTGIVHISVGNFHRSHQAMYLDTLMNDGAAMDWGICGIGLQPSNARMRDVMAAQDGLYTLVIRHGDGTWDARVIGSVVEYLFVPDDPEAAIEKMVAPATRIRLASPRFYGSSSGARPDQPHLEAEPGRDRGHLAGFGRRPRGLNDRPASGGRAAPRRAHRRGSRPRAGR
jgi:hypothetical protein